MELTQMSEFDDLNLEGELSRMGGGQGYYPVDIPKDRRWKVDKAGLVQLVIVPYVTTNSPRTEPGKLYYTRDVFLHRDLGPDRRNRYFDCVQTFGERCPIGDYFQANNIKKRAQRLGMFNVFVITYDETPIEKLLVLDHSYRNFTEELMKAAVNKAKRPNQQHTKAFMHPTEGSIVTFEWEAASFEGKTFYKATSFDFDKHGGVITLSSGKTLKVSDLIKDCIDLDAVLKKLPYDEAKSKFIDCSPLAAAMLNKATQAVREEVLAVTEGDDAAPFDADWDK
jgi:hypothetical protein